MNYSCSPPLQRAMPATTIMVTKMVKRKTITLMRTFMRVSLALLLLAPLQLLGQTCTGATCNAATPALADVLAALPSPSNTNATVVVNIPSGSVGWTGNITYTIPAAVTNLTIQGATTVNCTGTAGTSGYACTATDNTSIADNWNNGTGGPLLSITTGNSSSFFRMTGITWKGGTSTQSKYGAIIIAGNSQNVRLDHLHLNSLTYAATCGGLVCASTAWFRIQGPNEGVIDHNLVDLSTCNGSVGGCNPIESAFEMFNTIGDTIGYGDGTYANPTPFGTAAFMFLENNVFNGGAPNDCASAGTFVMRYNTITNSYVGVQTHATKSQAGPERGCRAYEAYNNYAGAPPGSNLQASGWMGSKIGTALVYNNTMDVHAAYRFFEACTDRNCGSTTETNTPQGWGFCGTSSINASTGNPNGTGSAWDGNSPSTTGYPCLDGLGRGMTVQPLNGKAFDPVVANGRLNSVTGTIAWPHQYLEPIYLWNNNPNGETYYANAGDLTTQNNRDYYYDCGVYNSSCSSFTGAAGTGFGLHSARPATCTAGPGGTFGASPTGSYGVAYFETDTNHLFVCTATNTWTNVYTPYVYPHPLVGGGTTFTLTANTTGSGTGTLGGTNCSSGTYASGTGITCTATPSGGSVFAGWSGGTCTGTGSCSFTLSANATVTATFNTGATTYTLTVSTAGVGSGSVSGTNCTTGTYPALTSISCTATPSGGSSFTGWSGTGGCTGTGACAFNISANSSVIATFGNAPAASPVWTPGSGTVGYGSSGNLTTASAGCTPFIYWQNHNPPTTADYNVQNFVINVADTYYAKVIGCPGFADSSVTAVTYALRAGDPTFSPTPGTFASAQTVTLADVTPSSTICYTTNGSTPASDGTGTGCAAGTSLYSAPFSVSTTTTVKALATVVGMPDSTVVVGTYTINGNVANPTFSPAAGSYGPTQTVTISTTTSGATICWTNDGSTPTTNGAGVCTHGTTYSGTISVSTSQTLKAIATKAAFTDSSVVSAAYTINGAASTPTFSPAAGSYGAAQSVTISTSTSGAVICYTTNGATPTSSSAGVCAAGSTQYVSPVSVSTSLTLKAIATKAGFSDSSVGSAAYVINGTVANVTFSPSGGSYGSSQSVTLSSTTGSAVICYTTDGSTPTATTPGTCSHGTTYSGAITVSASETITAIGTKAAFTNSSVTSASYTINGTLATPTFLPGAGTYSSSQSVTITSSSTLVASMTETSNANDMAGNAPHRNTYTNCATSCISGVWQPVNSGAISNGELACTTAAQSSGVTNGCTARSVVGGTITGTGTTALDNGLGQGGVNSATSVTNTYAGTTGTGCGVGATFTSNLFPALTLPGEVASSRAVFGLVTGASGNTSMLGVTKYNSNGDAGNNLERVDCASPNTISAGGQHYEWDSNYNTSGGSYMGFGFDYNFVTSKFRAAFQNAPSWTDVELCPLAGGACITTYSWPAGDYLFSERHDYWDTGCTFSGSNCAHYGQICLQLWNAGSPVNSLTCYNIRSAATHLPIDATPINKTTWTRPQYGPQHQWDVNATSTTLTANVAFDSMVAFAPAAVICYTVDGSTPTTDGAGTCTHGTTYTGPVTVASSLTLKAIATQAGFTDSAVGTAAYVIGVADPTFSPTPGAYATTQSVTLSDTTAGSTILYTTNGTSPACPSTGTTYTTPISVSITTTIKAIGCKSGLSDSNVVSGLYTINGTVSTPTFSPVAGTYSGSQSVTISSSTVGATLCYTIDGSTPTGDGAGNCTHGTTYSVPVVVPASLTLKAIGTKATFTDSAVGSAAYVITAPSGPNVTFSGGVKILGTVGVQ